VTPVPVPTDDTLTMDLKGRPLSLLLALLATIASATKVEYTVQCTSRSMSVRVPREGVLDVALEKWGALPGCEATLDDTHFSLDLPLDDRLACGTTRVKNKLTGDTVFYHRVGVTTEQRRQVVLVKCRVPHDSSMAMDNKVKRDVLPPEFVEPDYIEITSEVTGEAPVPILGVGVRQNGELVGGQVNVRPGTPLTMEVYLDNLSAGTYGILMSYMEVTDTEEKRETIIFNGCSVDPILFDNFNTTTGDYVSAKFRAFKFPETNYVLFRGTVDVCLDKCQGIACSNGQLGFGRRRRGIDGKPNDPNKIFEVTMMTFLKVDETLNSTDKDGPVAANTVKETIDETLAFDQTMAWGSAAAEEIAPIHSTGDEPTFIYFSSAQTNIQSNLLLALVSLVFFYFN